MLDCLADKLVGIAGAGGLGSNCAASLVRAGVGRLIVVDFDYVTSSNLNRQYYFPDQVGGLKVEALRDNLLRINPKLEISICPERVTPENFVSLFSCCDVVVEAFDRAEEKAWFIEEMSRRLPDIHLVAASGMAGFGRLEAIQVVRQGNLTICGDGSSEVTKNTPPLAPRVGVVANMEADAVLEYLLND